MAFCKSMVPRFKEEKNCAPPSTRYFPKSESIEKGHLPYDNQMTSRFNSALCSANEGVRTMSKLYSTHSEMQGGTRTSATSKPPRSVKPSVIKKLPNEQAKATSGLNLSKGSSVIQREMRTRGKAPGGIKTAVKKELPKEQESLDNLRDGVVKSTSDNVDCVEGNEVTDLRRRNNPSNPIVKESKHSGQEALLQNELQAALAQLKSAEQRMKEAQDKVKSLEEANKTAREEVLAIQASLSDADSENEELREQLNQQKLVTEQMDHMICQECKFLKGCEEFPKDEQADQVKKKVSADMIKKIYLKIEKYGIEMKRLGSILEEMQKEKIVIEKQREYVDECIAQFMR
ncbi:uncharacterized protein LOC110827663 isoform X3 [Zootermopsis nevadensis]|uniref:uncharacterized protein LOC110827663 isoform X3 n=1 Tax=Zootermopsis nevadensis TaxID=136037 RepID=UPI000B8EA99F|nr:uncharacterized protein LOC110827663 isoform X3 [Zootermopsis nevadensis]